MNKQTPLKISNVLHCATTLGDDLFCSEFVISKDYDKVEICYVGQLTACM